MPNNILKGEIQITAPGVKQTFESVNQGVVKMEQSLGRSETAIAKTKTNFTGLSRVIQDLPFGFIAISNNLEQLLPAAGGAGLALSTLISVVSFASIGFANWTRGLSFNKQTLKEQVEAIHAARAALNDYVETLNDVNRARILGTQNAQEELVKLNTLKTAIENVNIPIAKRKQLVDQLQEQYPKYFANINDETILAGGATAAYDRLSSAILASARARAAQDVLVDLSKQQLTVEQEQLDNNQQLFDVSQKINALKASGAKLTILSASGEERLTSEGAKMNRLQEQRNDLLSDGAKLQKTNIDLLDREKKITGEITSVTQANPDALIPFKGKPKTGEKTKTEFLFEFLPFDPTGKLKPEQRSAVISAADKFEKEFGNILEGVHFRTGAFNDQDIIDNANEFWKNFKSGLIKVKPQAIVIGPNDLPDISVNAGAVDSFITSINSQLNREGQPPIIITPEIQANLDKMHAAAQVIKDRIKSINEIVTAALQAMAEEIAGTLGQALGDALSGGDIGKAFKALGGFIGGALQALGKQMIALSPLIAALKAGIKTLNPAILLPAGIGLVAIGAILKNSLSNVPGFARGGVVPPGFPNDTFLARLSSGERIVPANQQFSLQSAAASAPRERLIAEVKGDILRMLLVRIEDSGRRYT